MVLSQRKGEAHRKRKSDEVVPPVSNFGYTCALGPPYRVHRACPIYRLGPSSPLGRLVKKKRRVRLKQLACRPLAPIWGRCSLRRRALAAVARVGVRSANDSQPAHTVAHAINSGRAWGCRVRLELRA